MSDVSLSAAAAARIKAINPAEAPHGGLRVAVNGGGCSGFSYEITLVSEPTDDDLIVERDGARLFIDPISLDLVRGSEIDWVEALIGSQFKVKNPNAKSSCGCGVSFTV
jgi:iron-sulfur cluster assembly accessory protein